MRAISAVAALDLRRLWIPVAGAGAAIGLFPSLTQGLGVHAPAQDALPFALGIAALIAGACFGLDFAENRPSFFFARPLSTPALFAGRIVALLGLVGLSMVAFLAMQWISGLIWPADPMARIQPWHVAVIAIAWSVALIFSLASAAHTRQRAKVGLRAVVFGLLRLIGALALTALMVGLFFDIIMRAYERPTPIFILLLSYVAAGLIASCAAIEMGRTNRLRIIQVLNVGMYVHTTVCVIAVVFVWFYLLRPGPDAITGVAGGFGSPDGAAAYVAARVDRGGDTYFPRFRVDLSTGDVRRLDRGGLNASREQVGQWHSRDGATQVWTEQTPMLLGGIWRLFRPRSSPLRFQSRFGAEQDLPLPSDFVLRFDWEMTGPLPDILPSSGGDVFAMHWSDSAGVHLAFMSPARGQLSVVKLDTTRPARRAWIFLPSGQLRVAFQHRLKVEELRFVDIEPATGKVTPVGSAPLGGSGEHIRVRFDDSASRALVEAGPPHARTVLLLTLDGSPQPTVHTLATQRQGFLDAGLLADGRIAVIVRQPPTAVLRVFSSSGEPLLTIPLDEGHSSNASEPFPNVLMVSTQLVSTSTVRLFDTTTGGLLRKLEGFRLPGGLFSLEPTAPPTTAGSRILLKKEALYLLPSLAEAPRLLLPRP